MKLKITIWCEDTNTELTEENKKEIHNTFESELLDMGVKVHQIEVEESEWEE